MKKLLLLYLVSLPMLTFADSIKIGDVYYKFDSRNSYATVAAGPAYYTGDIVVPDSVSYNDKSYPVTAQSEKLIA